MKWPALRHLCILLATSALSQPSEASSSPEACLGEAEVQFIIVKWQSIFTGSLPPSDLCATVNATVTENFVAYDNGVNFLFGSPGGGRSGPYARNRAEFYASVAAPAPQTKDKTFSTLFLEWNCRTITWRWEAHAISVGSTESDPNNSATPGTEFTFKGTDLLHVDEQLRFLCRADSSGDYLNFLYGAGVPVAFEINKSNSTCVPIDFPAMGYNL